MKMLIGAVGKSQLLWSLRCQLAFRFERRGESKIGLLTSTEFDFII